MHQPNYHLLLESILNEPLESIANRKENPRTINPISPEDIDIAQFLQDNLLWQETIPAQKAKRYKLPKTLPAVLRKALINNGINSLYSHQAQGYFILNGKITMLS